MTTRRTKSKTTKAQPVRAIADPSELLAAAEKAPSVFNIGAYFQAIYLMRQKGYSWRQLAAWLDKFGIEISVVHLRRLYVSENARLAELSAEELLAKGCPQHMVDELLSQADPTERLTAADPEDATLAADRLKMLKESGASEETLKRVDLSSPVTVDGKTI